MPDAPYLAPNHLAMLEASAISAEVREARGYYTTTTMADLERHSFSRSQRRQGLVIPIWNVWGKLALHLLRPDEPRTPHGKNKPVKYEFPSGMQMVLDVPNLAWLREQLRNPAIPLWITEGAKKADALASVGCCVVAVLGVYNFRGKNDAGGMTLLGDFEPIALNERGVYLTYDSDVMQKPEVHGALARLGTILKARHAHPRYVYLPTTDGAKVGIDDFLASGRTVQDAVDLASPTLKPAPHAPGESTQAAWRTGLQVTMSGIPLPTAMNIGLILDQHPDWQTPARQMWFDTVRGICMVGERPMTDEDATWIGEWMGRTTDMRVTTTSGIRQAVHARCKRQSRDLLQESLLALPPWDGTERLAYWLQDYASVPRDDYGMAVARLLPVAMVARAMQPGCQFRHVVVLCGPENAGKSQLLRALATPEWFGETSASLEGKEAHILLQGVWLLEFGELESLGRAGENRLKSYISMQEDLYVPKFANHPIRVPRRTVLTGTTNEEEILKGQTGNTRYLPVSCGAITPNDLALTRPQLMAEALHYWRKHPDDWWQLGDAAEKAAITHREARRIKGLYEDVLATHLADLAVPWREKRVIWTTRIAERALGLTMGQITRRIEQDIVQSLRGLKWTYDPTQVRLTWDGKNYRVRLWTEPKNSTETL